MRHIAAICVLLLLAADSQFQISANGSQAKAAPNIDWFSNGGPDGSHYSRLAQINRSNVAELKLAWSFDTGETGGLQASPTVVDCVLYAYTPSQKILALDA